MHAIGFAIGIERIVELLNIKNIKSPKKVGFIVTAKQADQKTYKIADDNSEGQIKIIALM